MKNPILFGLFLLILLVLLLFFAIEGAAAQMTSNVMVKSNELNSDSGILVVYVIMEGKAYRLVCNQAMPGCSFLKSGRYKIVELPAKFGAYECRDVEVYPAFASDPQKHKKLGEYCLQEK